MCGHTCVCYINLTMFSFQNEERTVRAGGGTGHSGRDRSRNIQDTLTFWETEEMKRLVQICMSAPRRWGQTDPGGVGHTDWPHPAFSWAEEKEAQALVWNRPPNDQMNLADTVLHFVSSFSYLSWPRLALLLEWRMFSMIQPHVYGKKHQNTKPRAVRVNTACSFPFWRFLPSLALFANE